MEADNILLPWIAVRSINDIFYERRFLIEPNDVSVQVWRYLNLWRGSFFFGNSLTKEVAMKEEDKILLGKEYSFITEQATKLMVLI